MYPILLVLATLHPGVWKSHGYGEIIAVDNAEYVLYDYTAATCLERERGKVADAGELYPSIEYPTDDRMVVSGSYYRYELRRIDALPAPCTAKLDPNDPFYNFDVFWHTLDENYAFFDKRGIDWKAMREQYRPRIHAGMTEKELYAILGELAASINDPHVFISNGKRGADSISYGSRDVHGIAAEMKSELPGREKAWYRQAAKTIEEGIEAVVRYDILHGRFKTALRDRITWGFITPDVAYLRLSLFVGFFDPPATDRELVKRTLEQTFDDVFTELQSARALVIDVSTNTGGAEVAPFTVASHLIDKTTVVYTKRPRVANGWGDSLTVTIEPAAKARFKGRVAILMSNNSVSSGETLPIMLQHAKNVVTVGTTTTGAFSDILMKPLPNGGRFGFSSEEITAADGQVYEIRGVPPERPIVVFDRKQPVSGYVRAVAAAVDAVLP